MARRRDTALDPALAVQELASAYGALRVVELTGAPCISAFASTVADAIAESCGEANLVEALIPHEPLSAIAARVELRLYSLGVEDVEGGS